MDDHANLTLLLTSWQAGDQASFSELSNHVYSKLRAMAKRRLSQERQNHTLQATALVNEAFIRLIDCEVSFNDRAHFFSLAGRLLRRILVDHARAANRDKRGASAQHITLNESSIFDRQTQPDLLELDLAINSLAQRDKRKASVIELQFFAGLNAQQIAEVLKVSIKTVERDGQFAKAWLRKELSSRY